MSLSFKQLRILTKNTTLLNREASFVIDDMLVGTQIIYAVIVGKKVLLRVLILDEKRFVEGTFFTILTAYKPQGLRPAMKFP